MTTPTHSNLRSVRASAGPLGNASEITSRRAATSFPRRREPRVAEKLGSRLRGNDEHRRSVRNRNASSKTSLRLGNRVLVLLLVLAASVMTRPALCDEVAAPFQKVVSPFLAKYCVACHGATKQKGDRRFDQLSGKIVDDNSLVDLQDILDQLNLSEMPPKDAPQPTVAERREVIGWLTSTIENYHRSREATHQAAVLRRLNSREYRNTVRDLLHLNLKMFDPTTTFPRDQMTEHLDTIGDTLVTS